MQQYEIYTDGSCLPNPGVGGYAAIIYENNHPSIYVGGEGKSTNNRMEFLAVLSAIKMLPEGAEAIVYTDSQLVINVLTGEWQGKKTKDFLNEYKDLAVDKKISFKWVKAHNGHKLNDACDHIASWARRFNSSEEGFSSPLWGPVTVTKDAPVWSHIK